MDVTCGGLGPVEKATAEVQKFCDEVKHEAEKKAGENFAIFGAKLFRPQVVAGINYFIKVHVGGQNYVHLRVFQSLPCDGHTVQLTAIQTNKTLDDPITYF
ncbi:cystatin-B-like isoform X1 [Brachyhypopomus gauderio]|uniref:cystatin-B-like isoform X1 n=1 Tax=Brachyhypopomus gauderio TaxID=698409 RepID=UPI004042EB86